MKCKIHKTDKYIYLPRRGFGVCMGCVEAGFYVEDIADEARETDREIRQRIDGNRTDSGQGLSDGH